jgi:hypothetical protein
MPLETMEMMIALRGDLPRGFRPTDVNPRLLYNQGPSVEGLVAIGDSERLLPDVERAVSYVRDRLVRDHTLNQISAAEVSEALNVPQARAERLLALMGSIGSFMTGAGMSGNGLTSIALGSQDVLAEYLAFQGIADTLSRREAEEKVPTPQTTGLSLRDVAIVKRNTAFILMSMDPQDDSLTDVCNMVKAACAEFNITAIRVDDIEHQEEITDRVLENIVSAEFIIADLTDERPNVYYEVGYAHALGKRPILLRKRGTRLHFDLSIHNAPEYRNLVELRSLLIKRFEAILGWSPKSVP